MDWWAEKASPSGKHKHSSVVVINAGKATSDKMPIRIVVALNIDVVMMAGGLGGIIVVVVAIIVGIVVMVGSK